MIQTLGRSRKFAGVVRTLVVIAALAGSGCSVKRYAINSFANTLAAGGSVFESDDDLVLVGEALPFSIKLLESLSAQAPDNRDLLLATSRAYLLYSYAFVHLPAERAALVDIGLARTRRARARNLYLRSLGFALRSLELAHPGIETRLRADPESAVLELGEDGDVATMYWTAAALGLAIAAAKNEAALLARAPEVQALIARALQVDETWSAGTLHEFSITWHAATRVRSNRGELTRHFNRALELSEGRRAGLYVSYAEATAIPAQDRERFVELMESALAVDVDADPDHRLLNVLAKQRASWLMTRIDELFI